MAKSLSALGVYKILLILIVCCGVGVFSTLYVKSPADIFIGGIAVFMMAEDWTYQTIDLIFLLLLNGVFLFSVPDVTLYIIKYIFIWVLFRCFFLWFMRFEKSSDETPEMEEIPKTKMERLRTGYVPIFFITFCIVHMIPNILAGGPDMFGDVYLGFMLFSSEIGGSQQTLIYLFLILLLLLALGERRRRNQPENMEEIWAFGDGDVWFLATWGAAIDLWIFFIIFFASQLLLLFLYLSKFFVGGELRHE